MLTDRPALECVCLCLACLLALLPRPAATRPCTQGLFQTIDFLLQQVPHKASLDCRLYTPSILDYMKCPSSALDCFAGEVSVLTDEWEIKTCRNCLKLNRDLRILATQVTQAAPGCLRCEHLREDDAENFLKALKETLQKMNEQFCKISPRRVRDRAAQDT